MDLRNPFGLKDGQIVMIEDIPQSMNGQRCGCVCPACKDIFEARMGDIRRHHFAHSGKGCSETNAYIQMTPFTYEIFKSCIDEIQNYRQSGIKRLYNKLCLISSIETSIFIQIYNEVKETDPETSQVLELLMQKAGFKYK